MASWSHTSIAVVWADAPAARLHFYFATRPGKHPQPPLAHIEAEVAKLTKTWEERVS
ncbi:MAG: hypothetical protein ACE5DS_09280, partial [Kiloniellaceae bacterium]